MWTWRLYPMLRIVIAFMLGIAVAYYVPGSKFAALIGMLASILIGFGFRHLKRNWNTTALVESTAILLFCVFAGMYRYDSQTNTLSDDHYSHYQSNSYVHFTAQVLEVPTIRNRARTTLAITAIEDSLGRSHPASGKLLAYFKAEDTTALYVPGDLILAQAKLQPTLANTNPYSFDYKDYLHNRGIDFQTYINQGKHTLVAKHQLNPAMQFASDIRQWAVAALDRYMPINNEKAVVAAMLLGHRNNITPELYDSYTDTGVVHVLAVSGLHVGILAGLLFFLLNRIPDRYRWLPWAKAALVALALAFYVLLTGAAPAVMRAAIMMCFVLLGMQVKGEGNIFNSLATAALVMLVFDPGMFFQASFQFSFLALTSIVYFQPKLAHIWEPKQAWLRWAWKLSLVAVAAQILVFPLTIYYFHKFPMYFMLSGIFAIPAASLIIYGGVGLLIFEGLGWTLVAKAVAAFLSVVVSFFNATICFIQSLPGTVADGLWMERSTMLMFYLLIACAMGYLSLEGQRKWMKRSLVMASMIVALTSTRFIASHHQTMVTIYDVYQGYAIDFFDGRKVYSLKSDHLTPEKYRFAVFNNRIKYGGHTDISLDQASNIDDGNMLSSGPLYQLGNRSFFVPDATTALNDTVAVDYFLVSRAAKCPPRQMLPFVKAKEMIVDKSVGYDDAKEWMEVCQQSDKIANCTSIYDAGAVNIRIL